MSPFRLVVAIVLFASVGCTSKTTADSGDAAAGTVDDAIAGTESDSDPGPVDTGKPDAKADTSKAACNPLANTGCTDPALPKCGYADDGKPACQKGGAVKLGQVCNNPDDCAEGLCLGCPNGTNICANFCISEANCNPGQGCNTITGQKYKVCDFCSYEACKIETVTCKDPTQACYTGAGNGPVCLPKGSAADGDLCSYPNDCAPGLACSAPRLSRALSAVSMSPAANCRTRRRYR